MILGCHVSMKAPLYLEGSVQEALSYQANALMIYTGAPQNTKRIEVEKLHIKEAQALMKANDIQLENLIVHAPYVINPANAVNQETGEFSVTFLQKEIERTRAIGARYIVLHPGSYTTADLNTGIKAAIQHLNEVDVPDNITICLETMAGKGAEIGYQFEQLAEVLEGLHQSDRYGICLDTCHINDAGYAVTDFDAVLDEFDHIIGLNRLHVIHLNDSKNPLGSHKDRHANIGQGTIGFDTLEKIACNRRCALIPKILETPYIDKKPPYKEEIAALRAGKADLLP